MGQSYQVILRYDGRAYHGWQRLKEHKSVQGALEMSIARAFGENVAVQGAGRTDRGAHAEGQSAGFRLENELSPEDLLLGLGDVLPKDIEIVGARSVPKEFHVREDAIGKTYEYRIFTEEPLPKELEGRVWHTREALNVASMEQAVSCLHGTHDFGSFATKTRFKKKSTVRDIFLAELEVEGPLIYIRFSAESFLNHMVRNMVRAVVKVGEGRYSLEEFQAILLAANRASSPGTAPASGLFLMHVHYAE